MKASYAVDPFSRLPDEVFVSILIRLPDLKSLCQYSLVSKHFASVISQLQFVSVTLQNNGADNTPRNMRKLLRKLCYARPNQFPRILDSLSLPYLKLPKFLNHFKELESIYLECSLHPEEDGDNPSFPKWMVEFDTSNSTEITNFVAFRPDSMQLKIEGEVYEEQMDNEEEYPFKLRKSKVRYCFRKSSWLCSEFICMIYMLAKSHPTINSITIADSDKRGKLVMGKEQLMKLRSGIPGYCYSPHTFFVPTLHLPVSGYILRGSSLAIFSHTTNVHVIAEDAMEKMSLACDEDEKLIYEIIIETLKLSESW